MSSLLDRIGMARPIIQAPMAGTSTPALAAAVCEAGGLGSLGIAAMDAAGAAKAMAELREQTPRAFNINLFVHAIPTPDATREQAWIEALTPLFRAVGGEPPKALRPIYKSFIEDDAMFAMLLQKPPRVVSFHFGLPSGPAASALREAGCILLATATSLDEAQAARKAGMDAVVAQGYEAGGHRGMFDPAAPDDRLGTLALTRLLAVRAGIPIIAAGGIMDGAGIAAALTLGAVAAQLGTAFIACPESSADVAFRAALASPAAYHTVLTPVISGRPARCLANRFTEWGETVRHLIRPDYPIVYDAGKALNAVAKASGEHGYGAQWAGQGAPLSRAMPAAELMAILVRELEEARG